MKNRRLLILLLGIFCLVAAALVYVKCLESSRRSHVWSSTVAINAALVEELERGNPKLEEILSSASEQWEFLAAEQYDRVITELAKSHNLDPSPKSSEPLIDRWGNRFEICYRKLPSQVYDFVVVSKGRDGIYGTEDDLVSRYESEGISMPKQIKHVK
jgi:hypothetical protein